MKLLIRDNKIIGTALDSCNDIEETITVDDIDINNLEQYEIFEIDGVKTVQIKIPVQVTMRQARLALLQAGLLNTVENAINSIDDDTIRKATQIEWEYAQDIRRDWQALIMVTQAMGMTETQLDDLFITASKL